MNCKHTLHQHKMMNAFVELGGAKTDKNICEMIDMTEERGPFANIVTNGTGEAVDFTDKTGRATESWVEILIGFAEEYPRIPGQSLFVLDYAHFIQQEIDRAYSRGYKDGHK